MNKQPIDKKQIMELLSKPAAYQYFFVNLDKAGWYEFIDEIGAFKEIPPPERNEEGGTIQFPAWWPGYYLIKMANKAPGKVAQTLANINTENQNAITLAMQAMLNLPAENSKTLLAKIDEWLNRKYKGVGLIDKYSIDLLEKLIKAGEFDAAFELFDILSKPIKGAHRHVELRFDTYHYRENIQKQLLPLLIESDIKRVMGIIEKRFKEAIKLEYGEKEYDLSYIGRPTIEDSDQNYDFAIGDIKDIFTVILRDSMLVLVEKDRPEAEKVVNRLLTEKYSLFRRLAIHTVRVKNLDNLASAVLGKRENLYDYEVYHEYMLLLKDKYGVLMPETKKQILDWVVEGPGGEHKDDPGYVKHWQAKHLIMIKEQVLSDLQLSDYYPILKECESEFKKMEHPEHLTYKTSWVGPTAPLDREAIKNMAPDEILDYIKNKFKPSGGHWQPTPEGLARILNDIVKENPAPYAAIAERFAEKCIYPTYISNLIRGLQDAWRGGKDFDWKPVISLCELVSKVFDEPVLENGMDDWDYGKITWTRGAIADLFDDAVKNDKHVIPDEYLPKIREILIFIIENDPNPMPEDETKYGGDNMDYVTYAINCTRGKAMEALFQYALRYARIHANEDDEKGKGPFPPGQRLEPEIKSFLEKRLKEETSPSVHSMYGRFFIHLYYLDQEWAKKLLADGQIFPMAEDKKVIWDADWQGYMFYSRFYEQIYKLLTNHYEKAIKNLGQTPPKKREPENDRLAEHIMIAYLWDFENLSSKDGLLNRLFEKAPIVVRQQAIFYIGSSLRQMKGNDPKSVEEYWPKLKALWTKRVKEVKDEELLGFIDWLEIAPENIDSLIDLIKASIQPSGGYLRLHNLFEYLLENAGSHPKSTASILLEVIRVKKASKEGYIDPVDMRKIIEETRKSPECKEMVNEAVNILMEIGYYDFRGLYVKDN
ncbi:MAG: hypothetical protein WC903_08540 [Candidatus Margulisiibacteriota bacterium]